MAKIDITKTELVWPGKYNEDGTRKEVPRVSLPFQIIETVNESRATREAAKGGTQGGLFDVYEGKEGDTIETGWRNKLIWGDNLLIMGSLLQKFSGKVDLIYIDPPFATGADFSFTTQLGDGDAEVIKEQSVIEEKAYRDTWGGGLDSYLSMLYARLLLIHEMLSAKGSLFLHVDYHVGHSVKLLLDEIFGSDNFRNEIVWERTSSPKRQTEAFGKVHDLIFFYSKTEDYLFKTQFIEFDESYVDNIYRYLEKETGRKFGSFDLTQKGAGPARTFGERGRLAPPPAKHWIWSQKRIDEALENGLIFFTKTGYPRAKKYLEERKGNPVQDIWNDKEVQPINSWHREALGYATQKPEGLLGRIVNAASNPGDLVADFFCGSGTTGAVAEKLGRRWIGCDLGRWGIHVTRKRLLGIESCKPFEVLNLGKYERQYWQGVTFGDARNKPLAEQALYEYLAFILKLYAAQPVVGMAHLHGKKAKSQVHIGAVDAPVTIAEIDSAVDECAKLKQGELHILGWEWEMGLYDLMVEAAKKKGVKR
jgi:adenine-specific DNA-methyltransferase